MTPMEFSCWPVVIKQETSSPNAMDPDSPDHYLSEVAPPPIEDLRSLVVIKKPSLHQDDNAMVTLALGHPEAAPLEFQGSPWKYLNHFFQKLSTSAVRLQRGVLHHIELFYASERISLLNEDVLVDSGEAVNQQS